MRSDEGASRTRIRLGPLHCARLLSLLILWYMSYVDPYALNAQFNLRWLTTAVARLYAEVDNDSLVGSVSIAQVNADETIIYTLELGDPEIRRYVVTDPDVFASGVDRGSICIDTDTV